MISSLKLPEVGFIVSAVAALCIGFFLSLDASEWLVRHGSYWLLLTAVVCFGLSLIRLLRREDADLRHTLLELSSRPTLLFLLLVTVLLFVLQPSVFKVLMDEPLLVSSSRQMHFERELYVPKRGYELGGVFYTFDGYIDKRPGFFPFLLSVLHDVTGYRSSQGFVLNAILVPFFVGLTALICHRLWPFCGRFIGPLLLLTAPLFAVFASSSGFDFLNLCLILLLVALAQEYARAPSQASLGAMLWCGVLLAHTRYESALYLLPIGIIALLGWKRAEQVLVHWTTWLIPIVLTPVLLLVRLIGAEEDAFQMREGTTAAFGVEHIGTNLQAMLEFLFETGDRYPNSWFLSVLFAGALVFYVYQRFRLQAPMSRKQKADQMVYRFMLVGVIAYLLLILSYHWGQVTDFAAMRLAMPLVLAQLLFVVAMLARMKWSKGSFRIFVASTVVYFCGVTLPVCARTDFMESYPAARWAAWLNEKVDERRDDNVLIVTQQRLIPVINEVSAITLGKALGAKEKLAFHHQLGTFTKILFVHLEQQNANGDLVPAIPLEGHFTLSEMERHPIGLGNEVVLSQLRVVHLSLEEKERMELNAPEAMDLSREWFKIIPETLP